MRTLWYILRMSLGEGLMLLGLKIMPRNHPHRADWEAAVIKAQTDISSSP